MATWRQYELGARVRKLDRDGEERLALDRRNGRPVSVRVYPPAAVAHIASAAPG